jgi:AcrR family transcriptional regulator
MRNAPYGAVLTTVESICTIRHRMVRDLGRKEWLRAARLALLKGGVEQVRVERLARDLHVTKGSFYWHFKDREELLEVLLREWEEEFLADIIPRLEGRRGRDAVRRLAQLMVERVPLGEEGILPSDAAMFTWASVSPEVARRANRAERKRIESLTQVVEDPERAELLYLVWLGFVARGNRVPSLRKQFPRIARAMLKLFPPERRGKQTEAKRKT